MSFAVSTTNDYHCLLVVAARHYLPIISDEIYAEMVFPGSSFHSIASVSTKVPALVCGGLSKQYMIPGWRIGWILIHDPVDAFKDEVSSFLFLLLVFSPLFDLSLGP